MPSTSALPTTSYHSSQPPSPYPSLPNDNQTHLYHHNHYQSDQSQQRNLHSVNQQQLTITNPIELNQITTSCGQSQYHHPHHQYHHHLHTHHHHHHHHHNRQVVVIENPSLETEKDTEIHLHCHPINSTVKSSNAMGKQGIKRGINQRTSDAGGKYNSNVLKLTSMPIITIHTLGV